MKTFKTIIAIAFIASLGLSSCQKSDVAPVSTTPANVTQVTSNDENDVVNKVHLPKTTVETPSINSTAKTTIKKDIQL